MDDKDSPGWRDLNVLQKATALVVGAVALSILVPLLWWAARWVVWLWKVAF